MVQNELRSLSNQIKGLAYLKLYYGANEFVKILIRGYLFRCFLQVQTCKLQTFQNLEIGI